MSKPPERSGKRRTQTKARAPKQTQKALKPFRSKVNQRKRNPAAAKTGAKRNR